MLSALVDFLILMTDLIAKNLIKPQDRAKSLLGVPWKARGSGRSGMDCLGLIIYSYNIIVTDEELAWAVEADYPACAAIPTQEASGLLESFLTKYFKEDTSSIAPGCCLAFSFKSKGGWVDHLGILTDVGLIHATRNRGVVRDNLTDTYSRRIKKVLVKR
jgi:cell wall-associated NlpC family hydrolase